MKSEHSMELETTGLLSLIEGFWYKANGPTGARRKDVTMSVSLEHTFLPFQIAF